MIPAEDEDDQRHSLDDGQKTDAREMLGCGWAVRNVARHFGLTEERLRIELGMPAWKSEPVVRPSFLDGDADDE